MGARAGGGVQGAAEGGPSPALGPPNASVRRRERWRFGTHCSTMPRCLRPRCSDPKADAHPLAHPLEDVMPTGGEEQGTRPFPLKRGCPDARLLVGPQRLGTPRGADSCLPVPHCCACPLKCGTPQSRGGGEPETRHGWVIPETSQLKYISNLCLSVLETDLAPNSGPWWMEPGVGPRAFCCTSSLGRPCPRPLGKRAGEGRLWVHGQASLELALFPQTPHPVHDEKGWEWTLRPPFPPCVHLGQEGWAAQPVCGLTAGPRGLKSPCSIRRGYARQRNLGDTQAGRPGWAAEVTEVVGSPNVRRHLSADPNPPPRSRKASGGGGDLQLNPQSGLQVLCSEVTRILGWEEGLLGPMAQWGPGADRVGVRPVCPTKPGEEWGVGFRSPSVSPQGGVPRLPDLWLLVGQPCRGWTRSAWGSLVSQVGLGSGSRVGPP